VVRWVVLDVHQVQPFCEGTLDIVWSVMVSFTPMGELQSVEYVKEKHEAAERQETLLVSRVKEVW